MPTAVHESISISPCGIPLPSHPAVPAEHVGLLFRTKLNDMVRTHNVSSTDGSGTYTNTHPTHGTLTRKAEFVAGICTIHTVGTTYTGTEDAEQRNSSGALVYGYNEVKTSSSSLTSPCSGSYIYTDKVNPAGNDSGEFNVCTAVPDYSPTSSWAYDEFTFTQVTVLDVPSGTGSITNTVTYSELVDATVISEQLAELSFPTHANGTNATAMVRQKVGSDPALLVADQARKSRTRFRIPATHAGSRFQIDGDKLFTPAPNPEAEDGDPPPTPTLSALPSLVWTGPGSGSDSHASWLTDWWAELEVPAGEFGTVELVNVRFTHMPNNSAGVKPQLHTGFGTYVAP
jgi:hypothetical protein